MNRTYRHAGISTGAVIGIIAVLVVLGVAAYFVSDVFRTKVDATATQYTTWTPENIAKDPVNYLNFAEAQTNQALQDLKANEIAIAQNRAKLDTMKSDASNKIGVGEKALAELKTGYKTAEAGNAWPLQWQGQPRDEDFVKRQIVSLHKQVESQKNLLSKVDGGVKKLDAQSTKVQEARAAAQEQIAEIAANRELLKVEQLTGDLKDRLVAMNAALQATVSTVSETSGMVSLDQLASESESAVDEAKFEEIMADSGVENP